MKFVAQLLFGILLGGISLHYLQPWLPPLPVTPPARPDPALAALEALVAAQHSQLDLLREQLAQAQLGQVQISAQLDTLDARLATLSLSSVPVAALSPSADPEPAPAADIELMDETAQRKEIAWKKFYSAPEQCQNLISTEAVVECGNHHIRKRREFEQLWEQGRIR